MIKEWVTNRFSYAMRHNDASKMTPHPLPIASFPEFRHNRYFSKAYLDICILSNLIVERGGWVIKKGAGVLHQIFRFSGGVNIWGRIHKSKSWYSSEPSQASKVDFCGNCFQVQAVNLFCTRLQLRCLTDSIRCFQKTLFMLCHRWFWILKKTRNIYTSVLDFTFQKKCDWLIGGWVGREGGCNKKE